MPLFGKRNLVMLLVIKIFVIGLLLSGCQEGTNKSPVSALFTSDDLYGKNGTPEQVYNNGSISGRIINDQTGKGQNGLYVMLYEWKKTTVPYSGVDVTDYELGEQVSATQTHEIGTVASSTYTNTSSSTGGYFEFNNIPAGSYAIYFGKSNDEPIFDEVQREHPKLLWKYFETNTASAPNYIHSVRFIDVVNNSVYPLYTSY